MKKVLKEALELVKPSAKDKFEAKKRVDDFLKKLKVKDAKVIVGGSAKKNTWLKDAYDTDIFVKYNLSRYKDKDNKISDLLEKSLKAKFSNVKRLHGSRDYFQVEIDGFIYEIIPILDIRKASQAKNITDVSPLHARWVDKHKKLADQIRLTKAFCKAIGIYGAESYIHGFSGYVCEIMTIYYGSFLDLIKNAVKWKDKQVVDVENYHKGTDVLMELNKSKIQSPLIVIDPVQADRNAAAALSYKNFNLFKKKARQFLKKPSLGFFIKKDIDLNKKAKGRDLIVLQVKNLKGKKDVIGCRLLKIIDHLKKALSRYEFSVIDSGLIFDDGLSRIYLITRKEIKPDTIIIQGPPINIKKHVMLFKRKHKNTFIKDKIIYAKDKRKYTKPDVLIRAMIKDDYVKERVKAIKVVYRR